MNLLEQQAMNRRRTGLIMAAFVLFLVLLGAGFDLFFIGVDPFLPIGTAGAAGIGTFSALASYYGGHRAVLTSASAIPIADSLRAATSDNARFKLRQLENVVEEMAIAAGLPPPKIYVIPDPDPNAFATGRDPSHAAVAVTRGLLEQLSRDELQGVVAHELAHIRNYDIRLMTVVAALVGAIVLLREWTVHGFRYGALAGRRRSRGSRDRGGAAALLFVIWLLTLLLAPLIGRLLALAVSRRREYLADATAAELTRNPGALAEALEKIDASPEPTRSIKHGIAHLCIADPLARAVDNREGFWADLFATHPPMAKRIAALRAMAYQSPLAGSGRPKAVPEAGPHDMA